MGQITLLWDGAHNVSFNNRNEYAKHSQAKHLKSLIINTDKGNTVAFSRISPGKFPCPTCFTICDNVQDVLIHLLCEESDEIELNPIYNNSAEKGNYTNQIYEYNSIASERQSDSDNSFYDFLLMSTSDFNLIDNKKNYENLVYENRMNE